jgi:hypothetical protein
VIGQRGLRRAIDRGAHYLALRQLDSGEIPVHLAFHRDLRDARRDPSVFGSAVAALSLYGANHPLCKLVVARAMRHIAAERRPDVTWSYWPSVIPVASDADDTACCSLALIQSGRFRPGRIRANLSIFERYRDRSGLFQTWFADGWNLLDSVVNANVLAYLGSRASTVAATDYLVDLVRTGCEADSFPYYADVASLHYAIARAMRVVGQLRTCQPSLMDKIRARLATKVPSEPLIVVAQSLSGLALLGVRLIPEFRSAVGRLLDAQRPDGGWIAEAYYTGPPSGPVTAWYGSDEIASVLCLEAIMRADPGQT